MIKRLIFDVDDTLIEWKDEYWNTLEEVFQEMNIEYTQDLLKKVSVAIDSYAEKYQYYNKEAMLEHINKITDSNFNMKFIDNCLNTFGKCVPKEDEKVINTLDYLSKKYELIILTNWFEEEQILRLKNFGIEKYFLKVFASENFKVKPNKESFITAMESRLPKECIMIGDSLKIDIQGAINVGMNAIYINPNLNREEKEEYTIINKIEELMEIL